MLVFGYNCMILFSLEVGFERILCFFFVYGCMIFLFGCVSRLLIERSISHYPFLELFFIFLRQKPCLILKKIDDGGGRGKRQSGRVGDRILVPIRV